MGYADTYASNHAAILRDLGRSQAEAKLRSGQAWGDAIGQVGQIAGAVPGQLADERRSRQQEAIWQANLDEFNQKRQENQWLKDAINSSVTDTGELDERRFTENLKLLGASDLAERALGPIRQAKLEKAQLDQALMQGKLTADEYQQRMMGSLAPYAAEIVKENGAPAAIEAALAAVRLTHTPELADALEQQIKANPNGVMPFVQSLITPNKKDLINVAEGGMVFDPNTGKMIAENPKPEPKKAFQNQPITFNGKPMMANFDPATGDYFKPGTGQPLVGDIQPIKPQGAPVQPSFSRAEVTLPDGTTKMANYDSKTGKYTDVDTGAVLQGVMSGPTADMRNKEQARSFVSNSINAIKEFSDRVIQRIGPSQRANAIKRGTEAVFGNDPDFRVYQDARMALAGNLAVAQQGSRPSDADIKSIWLPMIPDPYRDTSASAEMKWKLIDTMSVPQKAGAKPPEKKSTAEELIKKYGGG